MKKTILIIILLFSSLVRAQFWENPNQKPSMFGMRINRGHLLGDPVGLWLMSEGFASKVFDLSGNGNTGTFQGGISWSSGKFGPVPLMDGANGSYIQVPDSPLFDGKRTISFWFRRTGGYSSGSGDERLFEHRDVAGDLAGFFITLNNATGKIRFVNDAGPSVTLTLNSTIASWADSWYHFALVADGTNATIYIDGVYDNSGAFTTAFTDSSNTLHLGADRNGDNALTGKLDLPMVYNRTLSPSEIALLYREPFCFMEPNWDLNLYFGMSFAPLGAGQFIFINMN